MAMRLRSLSSSVAAGSRFLQSRTAARSAAGHQFLAPPPPPRSSPARRISDPSNTFVLKFSRMFSVDVSRLPSFTDPQAENAFKDIMASNWDNVPNPILVQLEAESKRSTVKEESEILRRVYDAAVATEEFGSTLVSLRMALDDLCGLTGENVGPLPGDIEEAIGSAYKRYTTYLDSFGEDQGFLRKKVEAELGAKMIHLKMRCSRIGAEWGKITLIGTSGLAGSYVEHRA